MISVYQFLEDSHVRTAQNSQDRTARQDSRNKRAGEESRDSNRGRTVMTEYDRMARTDRAGQLGQVNKTGQQ